MGENPLWQPFAVWRPRGPRRDTAIYSEIIAGSGSLPGNMPLAARGELFGKSNRSVPGLICILFLAPALTVTGSEIDLIADRIESVAETCRP